MDNVLKSLYVDLLNTETNDGRRVIDRINPRDLCISGHHIGSKYEKGLLVYGQAMNGWENANLSCDELVNEILSKAEDHKEMYTIADYRGWHGYVDGEPSSYYYKRSKFWKLNYLVATDCASDSFDEFYVNRTNDETELMGLLDNAWPQHLIWSNLFKVSYSKGGNPDQKLIEAISDISFKIVLREIDLLKPSKILFNTGKNLFLDLYNMKENVFNLKNVSDDGNVIYTGKYYFSSKEKCRIVVCRRPDGWNPRYNNKDIYEEAKEVVRTFASITNE